VLFVARELAKWGNKCFIVSPQKIIPLQGLSTSFNRKSNANEDTSGTAATNDRGLEPQTISLKTTYFAGVGVSPRVELEGWKKEFGKHYPLYINAQKFGPEYLELDSVSAEIKTDNLGRFIEVQATITFVEYVPPQKTNKSTTSEAVPSTTDKQQRKISPVREVIK
jgi:hypothetical protein